MSVCPKAVVTSKPGKEHWALEELWDTLYEIDKHVYIKETRYRGVFLVFAREASIHDIVGAFTRRFHAFIRSVIPAMVCLREPDLDTIINAVDAILRYTDKPLRVIFRIRGKLKKYIKLNVIEEVLRLKGIKLYDGSSETLVIEAVDDLVIIAVGGIGSCGNSCITVIPPKK